MEPQFKCAADYATFETYSQETRLVKILMPLKPEFEHVRSMFLHQSPLPHVDMALSELLSKDQTRSFLLTKRTTNIDHVLVSTWLHPLTYSLDSLALLAKKADHLTSTTNASSEGTGSVTAISSIRIDHTSLLIDW